MELTNLGAVGISAGGVYNPETVYKKYKIVSANGGSYMYINPTPAAGVDVTDTTHWQQISEKGDAGGPPGPPGPQGAKGDPGLPGQDGKDGVGVPAGGTTGQVLTKIDDTDQNVEWADQTGGGGGWASNILHNWDFRNPVNQRGVSGTISATGYFYDRWILNSGAVTTNNAYLTVGAGAVVEQRIEGNLLAGAVVTVSVMVAGTVINNTGTMPISTSTASVTLMGWGTATLGYATGYMYVRLSPTAASNVQAIKLELGTGSTLHLDPPMDHAVELAKCQRFFEVMQSPGHYQSLAFNTYHLYSNNVFFSVPKRVVPTVVLISESGSERGMITERNASGVFTKNMPAGNAASMRGFSIFTQDANNRFTAGFEYRFRYEASADL